MTVPIKQETFTALQVATLLANQQNSMESDNEGMRLSFEMKQASKGQKYFDIKISNIKVEETRAAMQAYDDLDAQLTRRALEGE